MAIAIRPIPTLYGEDAERFDQMVCEAEEKKANIDISNNIRLVKEFLRKQNWEGSQGQVPSTHTYYNLR